MFEAKVYKVMVGCPGDSMEELLVAKKVIAQWNEQNAEREGKLLYPIEWEASECNLQDLDIVIGIIGTRIVDTELIDKSIKAGKHVILFFRTFNDDRSYFLHDLERLEGFKKLVANKAECIKYDSYSTFECVFTRVFPISLQIFYSTENQRGFKKRGDSPTTIPQQFQLL